MVFSLDLRVLMRARRSVVTARMVRSMKLKSMLLMFGMVESMVLMIFGVNVMVEPMESVSVKFDRPFNSRLDMPQLCSVVV